MQPIEFKCKQTVDWRFAWQYDDNQLQALVLSLEITEHWFDLFDARCILAETRLTGNGHASVIAYSLQLLREIAQCGLVARALQSKACNRPDAYLDARVKLLATHVPHTLVGQYGHFCLSNRS